MDNVTKVKVYDNSVLPMNNAVTGLHVSTQLRNRTVKAAGSLSNASMKIDVTPPSKNIFCSRDAYIEAAMIFKIDVAVDASTPNKPVLKYGDDTVLRAFPFTRMIDNINIIYNQQSMSSQINEHLDLIELMASNNSFRKRAVAPTQRQLYLNSANDVMATNGVFGDMKQGQYGNQLPNGAFPISFTDASGNSLKGKASYQWDGTATNLVPVVNGIPVQRAGIIDLAGKTVSIYLKVVTQEPIFASPFIYNNRDRNNPLFNMESLSIDLRFSNEPGVKAIAYPTAASATDGVQAVSLSEFKACNLHLEFMNPILDLPLPKEVYVPIYNFVRKTDKIATIAAGDSTNSLTSNININRIPNYIYVAVQGGSGIQNLPINKLSLVFGNSTPLLTTASVKDLFDMTVRNGLDINYPIFAGQGTNIPNSADVITAQSALNPTQLALTGCGVLLRPGIDFPLEVGLVPGSLISGSFQLDVSYQNQGAPVADGNINVICVYEGFLIGGLTTTTVTYDQFTPRDIEAASVGNSNMSMVGSGFFDSIWDGIKSAGTFVYDAGKDLLGNKDVRDLIKSGVASAGPKGQAAAAAAGALGFGVNHVTGGNAKYGRTNYSSFLKD